MGTDTIVLNRVNNPSSNFLAGSWGYWMESSVRRLKGTKFISFFVLKLVFICFVILLVSVGESKAISVCVEGPSTSFVDIVAGSYHACGLTADGKAYCWGQDSDGQLGDGPAVLDDCMGVNCSDTPVLVDTSGMAGSKVFVQLVAGSWHTCGLASDGLAYCWGYDEYGQLGDMTGATPSDIPVPVDTTPTGGKPFVSLTAAWDNTCGLTSDGVAYCWGRDDYGQLGDGSVVLDLCVGENCSYLPVAVDTTPIIGEKAFAFLVCGTLHACGVTADGTAYCWGRDHMGQLGDGNAVLDDCGGDNCSHVPVAVDTSPLTGSTAFIHLGLGNSNTCGVTADGVAYCWGDDFDGALGNGGNPVDDCGGDPCSLQPEPVDVSPVAGEKAFQHIVCGLRQCCGLTAQGVAYCWGDDDFSGQLGNGSILGDSDAPSPVDTVPITGELASVRVTVGEAYGCILTGEGVAYCWGHNILGQLGDSGTFTSSESPVSVDQVPVNSEKSYKWIASGSRMTCAIDQEGKAYCWGRDTDHELGDGDLPHEECGYQCSLSAAEVDTSSISGEKAFVQVAGGAYHVCGLTAQGVAYCWGLDDYGQLGDGGIPTNSPSPVAVDTTPIAGEKTFVQVVGGGYHTCGLTSEGVAYCWGEDTYGQMGDGFGDDTSQSPLPVNTTPITGEKTFIQLIAGHSHACGLTADGVAYCWGNGINGELGDGNAASSWNPVPVNTVSITGEKAFIQLAGGFAHVCGLTSQRVAYCWGVDSEDQLGNGSAPADDCGGSPCAMTPVAVDVTTITGEKTFRSLDGGLGVHACGVTTEGVGYCWGRDDYGELGNGGGAVNAESPSAVDTSAFPGETTFIQLACGGLHTCSLTADGVSYCWGSDTGGQLGDGGSRDLENQSPLETGDCNDGVYCNGDDSCDGVGNCIPSFVDPCQGGLECNDLCNEAADNCAVAAGTACTDLTPNDCQVAGCTGFGSCNPGYSTEPDSTPCDDGNNCSTQDTCQGGACTTGTTDKDSDSDGYYDSACPGGTDCDDSLDSVHPGASEGPSTDPTCTDTHDNDCDTLVDINDPDCIQCQFDTDCDDVNVCTDDSCAGGVCQNIAVPDGQPCDDDQYCTNPDTCQSGTCCCGPTRDCSVVADACNDGVCNESLDRCEPRPVNDGAGCDDGQYCTLPDTCSGGNCTGPSRACDDLDPCTTDICDEANDLCDSQLTPIPNAEGPRNDPTCADGIDNDCDLLTDMDDPECELCLNDAQCNDGNPCTTNSCVSQQCETAQVTDGMGCDDGLYCTEIDECLNGICRGSARDCSVFGDQCNDGVCNEALDRCELQPRTGDSCDDTDPCRINDTCQNGVCLGEDMDCTHRNDECVRGECADGACGPVSMGEGTSCAGCYRCATSAKGTVCAWSSDLPAGRCREGECRIPMARCDAGDNCVVEGYCDQPVDGCGIPVMYGKGPGQTLDCRLPEGKVGVRVKLEPASKGAGSFLPVRVYLTNTPINNWSKCIYELNLALEFNPEGSGKPGGQVAYVLGSALLQGGAVDVVETVDEQNQRVVVLTLGGEDDCLPAPQDGGLWVLDFLLVRGTFEDGWFKMNVWAPCDSLKEVMGCHPDVDSVPEHRVSGTWFCYTSGKTVEERDVGQLLLSPTIGCQCHAVYGPGSSQGGREGGGRLWLLGVLVLLALRIRANYLKRANRDVTHRFEA